MEDHTSRITLSKSALKKNLEFLFGLIGKNTKFSSVVKGNAYGHGIEEYVPMAEKIGVNHFSVFNLHEALRVEKAKSSNSGLMIMGMIRNEMIGWAIEKDVEFYVFEIDRLKAAIDAGKKAGKPARIHIELETGLNRTGFNGEELKKAVELIKNNSKYLQLEGVCTHFAGAESIANYLRIQNQIRMFNELEDYIREKGLEPKLKHTASSAATLMYPETRMDMVRVGIAQYGLWPSKETNVFYLQNEKDLTANPLKRIMSWSSFVMSTKSVNTGEYVGYGNSFMADKEIRIATVPVGYSNGVKRELSNSGVALVKGQRAHFVGVVNMNVLMLNISDIKGVKKGDEVVFVGPQGDDELTVASFGERSNELNYEVLTRIPEDTPRIIVD